jgi:hypothetical protein
MDEWYLIGAECQCDALSDCAGLEWIISGGGFARLVKL